MKKSELSNKSPNINPRPRSITRQLIISMTAAVLLVSSLFIGVQYYRGNQEAQEAVERLADEYVISLEKSLEAPLWNFDYLNTRQIVASYVLNENVVSIRVTDSNKSEVTGIKKDFSGKPVERARDIYYQGEYVGRVHIALTPQHFRSLNIRLFRSSLTTVLLILLALTAVTGIVVRERLKAPLEHLGRIINRYAADDYETRDVTAPAREFERFVSVLKNMREIIKTQFSELQEAEENYRKIFENAAEGLLQASPEGRFLNANSALAAILKYDSPAELIGAIDNIPDKMFVDRAERREFFRLLNDNKRISGYEARIRCRDGQAIWASMSGLAVYDEEGRLVRYEGAVMDITERRRAALALRESEERYRTLFENAPIGFGVSNMDGTILTYNIKMAQLFGYNDDEFSRINANELYEDDNDRKRLLEEIEKNGKVQNYELKMVRKDGSPVYVSLNVLPISYLEEPAFQTIALDVTERKHAEKEKERLQSQLQQAQKMEAVGTLAGGIAHDFNNILMSIAGYASLIKLDTAPDHPHHEQLTIILEQVDSAKSLTGQLLGFASGGKYEVKTTDMNILLGKAADMYGRTRKEIKIHQNFINDLWTVEVDRNQMEQVFLNLFVNAWQAMPEGGDLFLNTNNLLLDDHFAQANGILPGRYIQIAVTDTGVGMDDATRRRVFDPFFTTKEMERGAGLGLASAYGIIRNHGGSINCYSEPHQGTTFNIYLPISEKPVSEKAVLPETLMTGHETILLVDDEDYIAELGREMLETLGYNVLVGHNGQEALEIYKQHQDSIALIILDMIMPGMSGGQAFDRLTEIDPKANVLLSSGYSLDGQAREIMERGCNGFIQKPFSLTTLSGKIREILDGGS